MSKEDIREISEVTLTSSVFGDRYEVTVDGDTSKFKSKEKAVVYRNEQLARQEEHKRAREFQENEDRLRAEYDSDPEYLSLKISPPLAVEPHPGGWFKAETTACIVDEDAYVRELNTACYELTRRGYEIVSLTPLASGTGGYRIEPRLNGGAGWGISWTEAVLILARKVCSTQSRAAIPSNT